MAQPQNSPLQDISYLLKLHQVNFPLKCQNISYRPHSTQIPILQLTLKMLDNALHFETTFSGFYVVSPGRPKFCLLDHHRTHSQIFYKKNATNSGLVQLLPGRNAIGNSPELIDKMAVTPFFIGRSKLLYKI